MLTTALNTRSALPGDRSRLDHLLASAPYLHNHLDWQPPQDWLGKRPFQLAFVGDKLVGVLAAPPDPPGVSWIRLAAVADGFPVDVVLDPLWAAACESLIELQAAQISCMVLEEWLTTLLQRWGFSFLNEVIVLRRERNPAQPVTVSAATGIRLRPAKSSDIDALTLVDTTAFAPPWQYSRAVIRQALAQATLATVAEVGHEIVGYQISSGGREGGHLARLAVRPDMQGRSIGRALASQVVEHFERRGAPKITVNTQRDNLASISIYHALGFAITDEHYTVWQRILIR